MRKQSTKCNRGHRWYLYTMKHYESPDENNAALLVLIGNNGIMYTCVFTYIWIYMYTVLFN